MTRSWLLWVPLLFFAALVAVAATGLLGGGGDRVIKSRLVGKPMPAFALPPASATRPGLSSADLAGRPYLVNVFASWCVPCAAEAPQLSELAERGVPVVGIAIRDRRDDLERFLQRHGNPYARIGRDDDSAVQLALGSSGVPETFVVDGRGVIRRQLIGVVMPDDVPALAQAVRDAR